MQPSREFGDLIDDWGTLDEPVNYLLAAYGTGSYPPGRATLFQPTAFVAVVCDYIAAHAAMYHAIKQNDTVDPDGAASGSPCFTATPSHSTRSLLSRRPMSYAHSKVVDVISNASRLHEQDTQMT